MCGILMNFNEFKNKQKLTIFTILKRAASNSGYENKGHRPTTQCLPRLSGGGVILGHRDLHRQ